MVKTSYNTTRLMDALEVWGSDEIADEYLAAKELIAAAIELISTVPGITGVYHVSSSMGSIYLDAVHMVDGEEASFTVRLSNHKRKPNGHTAPVWSFEPGDKISSVLLGLSKIEEAAR